MPFTPNASWTLFLDRDGVINQKWENDYVRTREAFIFLPGVKKALKHLASVFHRIIIVTNQQGIGKACMTHDDLIRIHGYMLEEIHRSGGRIDGIYYCSELAHDNPVSRKPNTGMAYEAKADFPAIVFEKSVVVGDSESDMEFGKRLGMHRVFLTRGEEARGVIGAELADQTFPDLPAFVAGLSAQIKG